MTLTLYGIKACDTVKKARAWLEAAGIVYAFHDYKTAGVEAALLSRWCAALGWARVLNRAGTTFRVLPEAAKAGLDEARAIALMCAQPSMIKRPVLERTGPTGASVLHIGFHPDAYAALIRP